MKIIVRWREEKERKEREEKEALEAEQIQNTQATDSDTEESDDPKPTRKIRMREESIYNTEIHTSIENFKTLYKEMEKS